MVLPTLVGRPQPLLSCLLLLLHSLSGVVCPEKTASINEKFQFWVLEENILQIWPAQVNFIYDLFIYDQGFPPP